MLQRGREFKGACVATALWGAKLTSDRQWERSQGESATGWFGLGSGGRFKEADKILHPGHEQSWDDLHWMNRSL